MWLAPRVDMYIYRDPEEVEREQADALAAKAETYGASAEVHTGGQEPDWDVTGAGTGIAGAVSSVPGGNVDGGAYWPRSRPPA
jgi:small subunit ribosomal protein SAe